VDGGVLKLRDGISLGWDDLPVRPILIEVSDGAQSAAFLLEVTVTAPDYGPAPQTPPPVLASGEDRAGVVLASPREALTTRPVEEAAAVSSRLGGLRELSLENGESVWLGPLVDRVRFSDGWLDLAADGPAAHAAAIHHAVLGRRPDGADLAPLVASLRAGAGWVEVAERLLDAAPSLAALDYTAFLRAIAESALSASPGAEALSLHATRLAGGATSRAQLAVDIALSPASLARLADDTPAGHWVADPLDDAADQPARLAFEEPPPVAAPGPPAAGGWFM